VLKQIETPQEKYNRSVANLDRLLKANKLSQEQYNRAVGQAKQQMDAAGDAGKKAGEKTEGAFGAKAVAGLKSYAAGVVSVTAAIALVKGGLSEIIRLGEEAAARARGSISSIGQLRQVSTSQQDFDALVGQARQVQSMGIEESRAAQIVFSGRSAGLSEEETMLLGQMEGVGFIGDTASMAANVKAIQKAMGTKETGGMRDIVSKSLAASGGAPAAAEQILKATAVAAGGLGSISVADEELLAAVANVSNVVGADVAGTQVRSLLFAIGESSAVGTGNKQALARAQQAMAAARGPDATKQAQKDLAKAQKAVASPIGRFDVTGSTSLMDMVGEIEAMGLDDQGLMELLGRKEAISAYRLLSRNRGDMTSLRGQIDQAAGSDLLGHADAVFRDPSLDAAVAAKAAEGAVEVGMVGDGASVNLAEALMQRENASYLEAGRGPGWAVANRADSYLSDWAKSAWDPNWLAQDRATEFLSNAPADVIGTPSYRKGVELINQNREAFGIDTDEERRLLDRRMSETAEKLDRAAARMEEAASGLARQANGGTTLASPGRDL